MTPTALGTLLRDAARRFGLRDLAIAFVLDLLFLVLGAFGGYLLIPLTDGVANPIFDPHKTYLTTIVLTLLGQTLPLVFAIRTAELAIADGARPWRAYLAALLAALAFDQAFSAVAFRLPITINRAAEHVGRVLWLLVSFGTQATEVVVMLALWRASQRTMAGLRASEARRARDLQQLRSADLLALQARVDPQLLFDALARVGALQRRDAGAADTLLGDLIALLRAMLPRIGSIGSTVEREFAVVRAWLRVTRALADPTAHAAEVALAVAPEVRPASLVPMILMPLVRAVVDDARWGQLAWRLDAAVAGGRLAITMQSPAATVAVAGAVAPDPEPEGLDALRSRLALLHGDAARLTIEGRPPRLTLMLPLTHEAAATVAA